ncbi:hypothetical protein [Flavobacterium fluviatile]|uniref:hypothetical protein n=1 Tax=Flavobacterium fluviatile TaxID=1862387 RepID=UPI0013D8A89F|nr:hypothetical protein [Flavobacterium fluviatile]
MILGFSTQINGKSTDFVEKIWASIEDKYKIDNKYIFPEMYYECINKKLLKLVEAKPKIHTIREDPKDRWKVGMMIDFFINVRTKKMFRFAPVLPVVSTQKVEIIITQNCGFRKRQVWIDDVFAIYYEYGHRVIDKGLLELVQNDGFDTIEDFFAYFNEDFTGKIIHWTDLKY